MQLVLFPAKKNNALYINSIKLLFGFLFFAGALLPVKSFSQVASNEGTEFWVAFPTHEHDYYADGTLGLPNLSIFITSNQSSSGKVSVGSFLQPFNVAANNVTEIKIPLEQSYIDISESGKILSNRAIHIKVDAGKPKVVVYAHIFAAQRSAASLIIPAEALGKTYASTNFKSTGVGKNYITLIATQPNTKIHLLKGNTELIPGGVTLPNQNDVYEYTSDDDLTGTRIVSDVSQCTNFAVFSGTSGSSISDGSCVTKTIDPLYQQCYPIKSWGYTYGLVPFSTQSIHFNHPVRTNGYHFRVVAAENDTRLTINGKYIVTLNSGDFYSSEQTGAITGDCFVQANKPVSVAQYALSQSCSNQNNSSNTENYSDPDMVILNPIEYNISNITIFSSSKENIREQYVNVLIKTTAAPGFRINGQKPAATFQPMKTLPGYSFLQLDLTNYPSHTFNLKADEGFNAIAYGFGNVESYAYSAGTNLASNYSLSAIKRSDNTVIDSACVNDDYFFKLVLPYITPKLIWQMDASEMAYTAPNPPYVTTNRDGKIAYEYMLPKTAAYSIAGIHHIHIIAQYPASECSSTATQDIMDDFKVIDIPDIKIAANKADCDNIVNFEDHTPNPQNIKYRIWNFDDPADQEHNSATGLTAKHIYSRNGTYQVNLTLINASGCQATKSTQIVITGVTTAAFNAPQINCVNKAASFTYTEPSQNSPKPIIWKWFFGDGDSTISDKNQQIDHYYKSPGIYQARLVTISETGCPNYSDFKAINILAPPTGDFDFADICAGNAAKFTFKGTLAGNEKISWDFGDTHATNQNPNIDNTLQTSHLYNFPGEYTVSLIISSSNSCETKIVKTIHVYSSTVTPDFTIENSCIGQAVKFKNTSKIEGNGSVTKIEWYFEPDSNPGQKEIYFYPDINGPYYHTYLISQASAGKTQTVKLRIFTSGDCFYDVSKSFNLYAAPNVSFAPVASICENEAPKLLTEGTENTGLPGQGYYSGDGITSTNYFDPQKAGVGIHVLTYTFITADGCPGFATQQVTVIAKPELSINSEITIIEGGQVMLKPSVSGSGLTFAWQPNTGLNYNNIATPIARPFQSTVYTLTASNGVCTSQSTITVNVLKAIKPVNTFTPNADGANDVWIIKNIEDYPQAVIQIFNRYGTELYHSTGYAKPWNGKYQGREVPPGVYYYLITPGKNLGKLAGYLTILR